MPVGKGQLVVSARYNEADEVLGAAGRSAKAPRFSKGEAALYGEYGLTDGFTMILEGNASSASVDAPLGFDEARWGLGSLGGRLRLWEGSGSILSVEAAARLLPSEIGHAAMLPVEAQGDVRLLAGHGFTVYGMTAFADVALGYRFAVPLEDVIVAAPDEMIADLTLGFRPWSDWMILAQSYNRMETDAWGPDEPRRSHKLEASVVHDLSPSLSIQLGVLGTIAGRDALRERGLIGAVWKRF